MSKDIQKKVKEQIKQLEKAKKEKRDKKGFGFKWGFLFFLMVLTGLSIITVYVLKNYFSGLNPSWTQSLAVITHTKEEIIFGVNQKVYLDVINRKKDIFEQVFNREFQGYFNSIKPYNIVLQETTNNTNNKLTIPH